MTPWEFLDNLVSMDRGPEHNEAWMLKHMKLKWPGDYVIEKYPSAEIPGYWRYRIAFNNPEDETLFLLRWS